jgi:hypothetical protein
VIVDVIVSVGGSTRIVDVVHRSRTRSAEHEHEHEHKQMIA